MKKLKFLQHIRTSSKSRKGFRTYQKSPGISDSMDEMLSGYGAYSPTAYSVPKIEIEDYPKLFLFYNLPNGEKVICLSEYVGTDLHSYPPRAGNYIAHSLVYQGKETFNPLEVYLQQKGDAEQIEDKKYDTIYLRNKAGYWKTKDDVVREDDSANAPFEIGSLSLDIVTNIWYPEVFQELFKGDDGRRKNMFLIAINAIIVRKKVIIIDESEKLIHWAFVLLQSFPLPFVFEFVSISSFANSNLLLDVCNVTCFEVDIEDRVRRYEDDSRIILNVKSFSDKLEDCIKQNRIGLHDEKDLLYAKALLGSGLSDKLINFRSQVDADFEKSISKYTLAEFNAHAFYFDGLFRVSKMEIDEFREFYSKCATTQERKDEIFEQIKIHKNWEKCIVIWEELKKSSVVWSLNDLINTYKYSNSQETDVNWMAFEQKELGMLSVDPNSLIKYWNDIKIHQPQRANIVLKKVIEIVNIESNYAYRKKILIQFEKLFNYSNEENKLAIDKVKKQIEKVEKILSADRKKQVTLLYEYLGGAEGKDQAEIISVFPLLSWEILFQYLDNKDFVETLIKLYESGRVEEKLLSAKRIVLNILKKEYLSNPELYYELYKDLSFHDKEEIKKYATKEIKKIISDKKPIESIEDLERALKEDGNRLGDQFILLKFIETVIKNKSSFLLWEIAKIIDENDKKYTNVLSFKKEALNTFYKQLENTNILLPEKFENLALKLVDTKKINRSIHKSNLSVISDDLLNIGTLSDLKNIKKILPEGLLGRSDIESIVKLPWEYYTWRFLYENLTMKQQELLPNIIGEQIVWAKTNERSKISYNQWCILACEYIIFLIVADLQKEFIKCINQSIIIDWEEYQYISNRLMCILTKHKTYNYYLFDNPTNKNKKNSWLKGDGPIWKLDERP